MDYVRNRHKRTGVNRIKILLCYLPILFCCAFGYLYQSIPDTIYIGQGEPIVLHGFPYLETQQRYDHSYEVSTRETGSYNLTLSLNGILPVKQVRAIITGLRNTIWY